MKSDGYYQVYVRSYLKGRLLDEGVIPSVPAAGIKEYRRLEDLNLALNRAWDVADDMYSECRRLGIESAPADRIQVVVRFFCITEAGVVSYDMDGGSYDVFALDEEDR